jgi:hypothetical protein
MLRIAQDAVVRIGVGQGAVMDWARMVAIAGITVHPNETWMKQMARNATMDEYGALLGPGAALHPCLHRRARGGAHDFDPSFLRFFVARWP